MFGTAVVRAALAGTLVICTFAGCRRDDTTSPAAALFNEPFFIRGPITHLGAPWGNLVTGEPGTNYNIDRAYFRTSAETEFRRADGRSARGRQDHALDHRADHGIVPGSGVRLPYRDRVAAHPRTTGAATGCRTSGSRPRSSVAFAR